MRVNVYAEEMTHKVEVIGKEIDGHRFTGLRFYLELPATVAGQQYQGPFMHRPGDDDSSAVTFWGKRDLREVLRRGIELLDEHYAAHLQDPTPPAIGTRWSEQHGVYAGIVRGEAGQPDCHLIVLEEHADEITWHEAMKWVQGLESQAVPEVTLPTRREQALLYANVPELFQKECYWSREQSASYSDYAWLQGFNNGYQDDDRKDCRFRARAVRRVPIR